VLDLAPLDGSHPLENHTTVERELREHGGGLAELPRILCLSKADLVPADRVEEAVAEWRGRLGDDVVDVLATSAATGAGTPELAAAIFRHVPPEPERAGEHAPVLAHRVYRPGAGDAFRVERSGSGAFRIEGEGVERLVARHDTDNEEALRYLEERLRAIGVIKALEAAGFEAGDDVEIAGIVFELDPGAPFR
jgi:GTP-binding protein